MATVKKIQMRLNKSKTKFSLDLKLLFKVKEKSHGHWPYIFFPMTQVPKITLQNVIICMITPKLAK